MPRNCGSNLGLEQFVHLVQTATKPPDVQFGDRLRRDHAAALRPLRWLKGEIMSSGQLSADSTSDHGELVARVLTAIEEHIAIEQTAVERYDDLA